MEVGNGQNSPLKSRQKRHWAFKRWKKNNSQKVAGNQILYDINRTYHICQPVLRSWQRGSQLKPKIVFKEYYMFFKQKKFRVFSRSTSDVQKPNLGMALSLTKTPVKSDDDFYADLETVVRISKAQFDLATGQLEVNGWCLTPEKSFDLFLQVEGTSVVASVKPETEDRADVFKKMPQYGNKNSGWRIQVSVPDLPAASVARIVYVSEKRKSIHTVPISSSALNPLSREQLRIRKCLYSPLRSQIFIEADIFSERDDLSFQVNARNEDYANVVHTFLSPTKKDGNRTVKLSIVVSGIRDKEEIKVSEDGNPALEAIASVVVANDSPRRVTASTASVRQDIALVKNALDLDDLVELKRSLVGHSRPARVAGEICFFPAFDNHDALSDHFHRASWYLTGSDSAIKHVTFGAIDGNKSIGDVPEYFAKRRLDTSTLEFATSNEAYTKALMSAQIIFVWRPLSKALQSYLSRILGKNPTIITVATDDPASVEYGNYCRSPWISLPVSEKSRWLKESQERFRDALDKQRKAGKTCSAVFGTGPSIDSAFNFDFRNCLSVVCNSVVANDALLDHIRPSFVCAGDAVSHFGVSKYAEKFRADLIRVLTERDIYLFTSAAIGFLLVQKHPEVRDRVILCEQGFTGLNCELENIWSLPRFDSTLNIHMLPIAATFSDTVFMLGLDGRDPNPANNEDFWAHSKAAQYHDLVNSGHEAHPTFAINRAQATEDRYLASVQESFLAGEALGKSFFSLAPSFTPAVHARPVPERCLEADQTSGLQRLLAAHQLDRQPSKSRALVVMRVNRRHFSGGRYHGTMLAEAMAEFCDEVVVWSDNIPPWSGDLSYAPNHEKVHYWVDNFLQVPEGDFEYVVLLPDGASDPSMYYQVLEKARACNAKVAFMNFESPNWFNALSPVPKKLVDADNWFATACFSDIIISSANTAVPFAKTFYQTLFHKPIFVVAPPAINSPIADLVKEQKIAREKQIILISRFGDTSAHKNINAIFDCITPEMEGYTLALIAGTSVLPDGEVLEAFVARLKECGLSLKLLHMISDREKYEEIAKSELMIFPSLFEGFGYPPVEAGYMGTPCITYDLPVLKEFNLDHAYFVPWGDHVALHEKISAVLQLPEEARIRTKVPLVLETAGLKAFSQTLQRAFDTAPVAKAASKFTPELFELARKVYRDSCHETELICGPMSEEDLYSIVAHYERLEDEAREKLRARQGEKRVQV